MKWIGAGLLVSAAALAGCETAGSGDRVNVSANSSGVSGSARVVDTDNVDVNVGTGGASASVKPGGGPVKVGIGKHGLKIGI